MKRCLPYLLMIVSVLVINCGNEPPDEFFEGTPADDSLINDLLAADPTLLSTNQMFYNTYIPSSIDTAIKFIVVDQYFRTHDSIIKQHIDQCALELTDTARFTDLWYAKDTTCTVYLWDTFTFIVNAHWDKRRIGLYDSVVYDPITGDSLYTMLRNSSIYTITTGGDIEYSGLTGEGLRHIFFDAKRDSTAVPETLASGQLQYPIKDPREWFVKRISYGTYYYPDRGAERPLMYLTTLTLGSRVDTISSSNTDTLYHGHVMNRFRHIDSLLEYTEAELDGNPVQVHIELDPRLTDTTKSYSYYVTANGVRKSGGAGVTNGNVSVDLSTLTPGVYNIYFEVVMNDAFTYVLPAKDYAATAWLVPIRIK